MNQASISRRSFLAQSAMTSLLATSPAFAQSIVQNKRLPNIIIVFTDDQGYEDLGVFGAEGFQTPNLDRMANEGVQFTDFYVAQPVCGASRAALLTGCYPNRNSLLGAPDHRATHGIHENEMTIAECLKPLGYATGLYGKWHLGHRKPFLPTRHGFDDYFGLPYSNDMWPKHPQRPDAYPPLPLIEGEEVIETNPDQSQLTTWYTERAVKFIEAHHDQPFFLYVAHSMPHVPLFVSDKFEGATKRGLYGDVIREIDWSVGQIRETLQKYQLEEDTFFVFTSDNGPWLSYGTRGGSADPLREGKGTTWEGGVRVPTVMWWPGQAPAGSVCQEPAMTIDLLPTIAAITGGRLPNHPIDGKDIRNLLMKPETSQSPHEALFFYWGRDLQAVRSGPWKMHYPHRYRTLAGREGGSGGQPVRYEQHWTDFALYNLREDIGETNNLYTERPDVVSRMIAHSESIIEELGDSNREGSQVRPAGQIEG